MFASTMARFNGVAALGLSVGLTGLSVATTALAESPAVVSSSPYQPAAPDSSVYRPGPQTSYGITHGSAGPTNSAPTLMARGPQVHPTVSTGDRFSRVDLTVASALAAFARPKEMPTFHNMRAPEALAADVRRWSERPTMRWVLDQYRMHRSLAA